MKRLIYTLFILLTICYSCDSFLDVRPTGEIVNNELFETAEGFEEAIYGVYSYLAREPLYGKNMTYGLVDVVGQYFAALTNMRSVGVMGDERTYERAVALRAVTSTDAMTADWAHLPYEFMGKVSNDIINKVKGVNRVTYDISSKPPATIEWE